MTEPPAPRVTLGLDIGGTKLLAVAVDEQGHVLARRRGPTLAEQGPHAVQQRCRELLGELRGEHPQARSLGVAFAGLVDRTRGLVRSSIMLPGWDDVPLADNLGSALELPCSVENDASAAARGEWIALGCPPGLDMVLLAVGTGIGGALLLDGRLHEGARGLAGEVGNMTIDWHGETCWCGSSGCLNTLASGSALSELAWRRARDDERSRWHGAAEPPPLQSVAAAASEGDALARAVIDHGARALGAAIANLANLLDPHRVALCGGVIALGDGYLNQVRATVAERALSEIADELTIAVARHGHEASAFGAACLAREAPSSADAGRRGALP